MVDQCPSGQAWDTDWPLWAVEPCASAMGREADKALFELKDKNPRRRPKPGVPIRCRPILCIRGLAASTEDSGICLHFMCHSQYFIGSTISNKGHCGANAGLLED